MAPQSAPKFIIDISPKIDERRVDPKPLLLPDGPGIESLVPTWRIVAMLLGVTFCTCLNTGMVAPILPWQLSDMGASPMWNDFIFSIFPMATLLMTPLAKTAVGHYGRIELLFLGLVLQCVSTVSFAYADVLTGGVGVQTQAALAIFAMSRVVCGIGSAFANVAIFAIAVEHFSQGDTDRIGEVSGYNQVANGLGFTLGPPLGNFLFVLGGFHWPYSATAGLMLVLSPGAFFLRQERSGGNAGSRRGRRQTRLLEVVRLSFLLPGGCVLLGTFVWGLVQPSLGEYCLKHVGVAPESVGLFFAVYAAVFSIAAPFVGKSADIFGASRVCAAGTVATGVILASMMGPIAGRLFEKGSDARITYEVISLSVLGLLQACMIIPTLSAMRRGVGSDMRRHPGVGDCISAWFVIFFNFGLSFGPVIGAPITQLFGFEYAALWCGVCIAAYGVLALALDAESQDAPSRTSVSSLWALGSLRTLTLFPLRPKGGRFIFSPMPSPGATPQASSDDEPSP